MKTKNAAGSRSSLDGEPKPLFEHASRRRLIWRKKSSNRTVGSSSRGADWQQYLASFSGDEGVLYVGRAHENTHVVRKCRRCAHRDELPVGGRRRRDGAGLPE